MYRPHRSSSFTSIMSMTLAGLLAALFSGCAHELTFTSDTPSHSASLAAFGEHTRLDTPRSPAAACDQYLALLSGERLQTARSRYGKDGQCWSGDASQQRACAGECRGLTYSLIKGSLGKLEAEKQQQARARGIGFASAQE